MFRHVIVAAVLTLAGSAAMAQITVKNPWVRGTVAAQTTTGAFMELTAPQDARLVGVRSPLAATAEIHEMATVNNVMTMRPVAGIDLPAGRAVTLAPGGYHVMLFNLTRPLKEGDTVPLTLLVERPGGARESVEVQASVRALGSSGAMSHSDHHH
jgi:periplasmic copper chaperone A